MNGGKFEGRRVVVTGGGSGIGRATVERLSEEGATVAVWDVRLDAAREAAAAIGGVAVQCDVGDFDAVAGATTETVGALGGIDGLLNAAGIFRIDGGIAGCPPDVWELTIRTNLTGTFLVSRALLPHLRDRPGVSAVVNIASIYGLRGLQDEAAYDASKGGVANLTRQMALDLAPMGIRVNAVAPGEIATPMMLVQLRDGETPEEMQARLGATVPIGRVGKAEEVAAVIAFLLSADASYVAGAILTVDGALTAG
jgi:NAD(P)-dependent dehydrogenase (short-subunit alcohol dehydrogenase family)